MVKLVRNAFQATATLNDNSGKLVKWSYLVQQQQEKEHLHLSNKLRLRHIYFHNQKMKVKLATQLMSSSVAKALTFCSKLNLSGFTDVEGTVNFLQKLNDLFDYD